MNGFAGTLIGNMYVIDCSLLLLLMRVVLICRWLRMWGAEIGELCLVETTQVCADCLLFVLMTSVVGLQLTEPDLIHIGDHVTMHAHMQACRCRCCAFNYLTMRACTRHTHLRIVCSSSTMSCAVTARHTAEALWCVSLMLCLMCMMK